MNQFLEEIYDNYFELDEEERILRVKEAVRKLREYLQIPEENFGLADKDITVAFFGMFVAADLRVHTYELNIFNSVFDQDYSLSDLADLSRKYADPVAVSSLDLSIDRMNFEYKNEVCIIGLSLISSDDELSEKEEALFERILAN